MRIPLMILAVMTAVIGAAQSPPPIPAEARDFDFWLGRWIVVQPDGKIAGKSRIESILDGRGIQESYRSPGGFYGHSYNSYNAAAKRWEQFWVDNSGTVLHLKGGLNEAGEMVLKGERATPDGPILDRITWTSLSDGKVRQHWETSKDQGGSWNTIFDGTYQPNPGDDAP